MKQEAAKALIRKYSQAYVNVFIEELSQSVIEAIATAAHYLDEHKHILFFLKLSAIDLETKKRGIDFLADRFVLPPSIKQLILLLIEHKRAPLVTKIFYYICTLYYKRKGMHAFKIVSSHELSKDDLAYIKRFLAQLTQRGIIYEYKVDKRLIAGIRLQSDTLMWEYSIAQQLNNIRLSLIR